MSGPKGYGVQLSPAVRRAQEERRLRVQCLAQVGRAEDARTAAADLGHPLPAFHAPRVESMTLEALQQLEQQLTITVSSAESALEEARRAAARNQLAPIRAALTGITADVPAVSRVGKGGAATMSDRAVELRASLSRCLDRATELDRTHWDWIEAESSRVIASLDSGDIASASRLLLALQSSTQQAADAARRAANIKSRARDITVSLADLVGAEADGVRCRLAACTSETDLTALQAEAAQVRANAERERDRSYVIAQTRAALRELGYELGPNFDTLAASGDAVIARRPDLPDHGVQVRFATGASRVLTRVIALADSSAERDIEIEEITCHDLGELQVIWQRHGVHSSLYHHLAPGERPVEHLTTQASGHISTESREHTQQMGPE